MLGGDSGEAFAAELGRLKRRGSAVLVVSCGAGGGVCRDLLGSADEARRRVLVRGRAFDPLPVPDDRSIVVEPATDDVRSAVASAPGSSEPNLAGGCPVETVVAAVVDEVCRETADSPDPGELRVCLGSLDALIERNDVGAVSTAVDEVFRAVRSAEGMGHAHLSTDVDASVRDRLRDAFDVTVETRSTPDGVHQQRWRLHAAGIDTGWLAMFAR